MNTFDKQIKMESNDKPSRSTLRLGGGVYNEIVTEYCKENQIIIDRSMMHGQFINYKVKDHPFLWELSRLKDKIK